jgi:broad specificity phosphatase PhoE
MHDTFLLAQPEVSFLALVRHAQQQRPDSPVFTPADWVDPPLSETDRRQAEVVGPFGESSEELRHRVVSTVEGLLAMHQGANLVVVCHGGVINAYLAYLLGIVQDMFFLSAHASVTRIRRLGEQRALHSLNDRDHLVAAGPELLTY